MPQTSRREARENVFPTRNDGTVEEHRQSLSKQRLSHYVFQAFELLAAINVPDNQKGEYRLGLPNRFTNLRHIGTVLFGSPLIVKKRVMKI
jgi:hypothetical protein